MPTIVLPTLHAGQAAIYRASRELRRTKDIRFFSVRCGRRYGKTLKLVTIAADTCAKGRNAGIFTPEHKQLVEPFDQLREILAPLGGRANKTDSYIRPRTGGKLDGWTLNDNDLAGRGREYHMVGIDEAAFTKKSMMDIWNKGIRPTLLTTRGEAWVYSTPNGVDEENFFYQICHDESLGFHQFHAPTSSNPYVPPEEIERERAKTHPLVFKQEYMAEFVDWSGVSFFDLEKLLVDGRPVPFPDRCDTVFAVIDTAIKTGKEHDGTAVTWFAYTKHAASPLLVLDYDKIQIEGASLETWLPGIYQRIVELSQLCGARFPSLGAFIEDKGSGTILLQQAARHGWDATAIPSELTAVGKDERAISVSGYVYNGKVKISVFAFDKLIAYKGITRNHFVSEVTSFRIGDKDPHRADDLTDTFTYGISMTLGDSRGY